MLSEHALSIVPSWMSSISSPIMTEYTHIRFLFFHIQMSSISSRGPSTISAGATAENNDLRLRNNRAAVCEPMVSGGGQVDTPPPSPVTSDGRQGGGVGGGGSKACCFCWCCCCSCSWWVIVFSNLNFRDRKINQCSSVTRCQSTHSAEIPSNGTLWQRGESSTTKLRLPPRKHFWKIDNMNLKDACPS